MTSSGTLIANPQTSFGYTVSGGFDVKAKRLTTFPSPQSRPAICIQGSLLSLARKIPRTTSPSRRVSLST